MQKQKQQKSDPMRGSSLISSDITRARCYLREIKDPDLYNEIRANLAQKYNACAQINYTFELVVNYKTGHKASAIASEDIFVQKVLQRLTEQTRTKKVPTAITLDYQQKTITWNGKISFGNLLSCVFEHNKQYYVPALPTSSKQDFCLYAGTKTLKSVRIKKSKTIPHAHEKHVVEMDLKVSAINRNKISAVELIKALKTISRQKYPIYIKSQESFYKINQYFFENKTDLSEYIAEQICNDMKLSGNEFIDDIWQCSAKTQKHIKHVLQNAIFKDDFNEARQNESEIGKTLQRIAYLQKPVSVDLGQLFKTE